MTITSVDGHDRAGPTANRPSNMEPGMTYMDTDLGVLYAQTLTGLKSVSGHMAVNTVAAAGTNQGTAAALSAGGSNSVTGADGTKGVVLPTNSKTDFVMVYNTSAVSTLKVYAAGTNTINGGSAGGFVVVEPLTLATFLALDNTNWAYDGTQSGDVGPLIVDSLTGAATPFPIAGLAGTAGGAITVTAGAASAGVGGSITISAGAGVGSTNAGGNLNLVPGPAASTGIPGEVQVNGDANMFFVSDPLTATDATRTVLVCTRACRLKSVKEVHTTASSSGTLTVEKATGTTAPGSGTALLTGTMSLAGAGNTVVSGTLIATVASLTFAAGDRLNIVIAGTMTNLVGSRITIGLTPV